MNNKQKMSTKERIMILAVIILAFGLTVGAVTYFGALILKDNSAPVNIKNEVTQGSQIKLNPTSTEIPTHNINVNLEEQSINITNPSPTPPAPSVVAKNVTTIADSSVSANNSSKKSPPVSGVSTSNQTTKTPNNKVLTKYELQLASFNNISVAEKEANKFKSAYNDTHVLKADLGDKGIWYRVRCCATDNKTEIDAFKKEIGAKYKISPIVVNPK